MIVLTPEQHRAVEDQPDAPVPVLDQDTNRKYFLVPAEQFERFKALVAAEEYDVRELYPLIAITAAEAGWNDPLMDDYDNYDEHRK